MLVLLAGPDSFDGLEAGPDCFIWTGKVIVGISGLGVSLSLALAPGRHSALPWIILLDSMTCHLAKRRVHACILGFLAVFLCVFLFLAKAF